MKEENIDKILDLGVETLTRKSYHSVGLKELLDTAGIPKGSFYYYFQSKEDFGQKVIVHYSEKVQELLTDELTDDRRSPGQRFSRLFRKMIEAYKSADCKEGCLMGDTSNELAGQATTMQIILEQEFEKWSKILEGCISEGQVKGEFTRELKSKELADYILNSWEGALIRMKATRSIRPFKLFADYTLKSVLPK